MTSVLEADHYIKWRMFGTENMRFNQKELAFIATRTDIPFDKEGILWLKEKEGHFWQRNEGNCLPDDCELSLCSFNYEPIKIWKIFMTSRIILT